MAEIRFNIPDGSSCKDCPHQESFGVSELECTTLADTYPKFIRVITANCHLFNEPIQGTVITEMEKCKTCKLKSEEEK